MGIIKKYNGEGVEVASKKTIDHSELSGTQNYGCHPISAIRKLPEKLNTLKSKDDNLQTQIDEIKGSGTGESLTKLRNDLETLKTNTGDIILSKEDEESSLPKMKLTNPVSSESSVVEFIDKVDDDTIEYDNGLKIKKVYTDTTLSGLGTAESPLKLSGDVKVEVDEKTIKFDNDKKLQVIGVYDETNPNDPMTVAKVEDIELLNDPSSNEIIFVDYKGEQTTFLKSYAPDGTTIGFTEGVGDEKKLKQINVPDETTIKTENEKYVVYGIKNDDKTITATDINNMSTEISNLKGLGGYLTAYNFETATPTQEQLTAYARQQIGLAETDPDTKIFNQTRVKNLYDNNLWILTNTPNTTPAVFEWANDGNDTVNVATNTTLGIVKGSTEDFEGSIDTNGVITINNLEETLAEKAEKTTTIAGLSLEQDRSASEVRTAINVEDGAQVNKIESISVNDVTQTITNKNVNLVINEYTVTLNI